MFPGDEKLPGEEGGGSGALFDAGSLQRGPWQYFPVVPGSMEFAVAVRQEVLTKRPKVVAVELPHTAEEAVLKAIRYLPRVTMLTYPLPTDAANPFDEGDDLPGDTVYVPVEPSDPFIEAVRSAREIGAEVVFIEPSLQPRPHLPDLFPDPYSIRRIPIGEYVQAYRLHPQQRNPMHDAHAAGMAWRLQGADPFQETLVVVSLNLLDPLLDAMQQPQEEPGRLIKPYQIRVIDPQTEHLAEVCHEPPYINARYERWRIDGKEMTLVDRQRANWDLLREAEAQYHKNTGDNVTHWQRRAMAKYSRNLCCLNGQLVSGLLQLTVAARSIVDDNYGWEVWDVANRYQGQKEPTDLERVPVSAEEVWINTQRIRLRRRLPRAKQRLMPKGLKGRKKEKEPGEWQHDLDGDSICSYPPEDIEVENYGRFLKDRARKLLSEDRVRIHQFTTSIFDGIDLRETVRNWHQKKIYVREGSKMSGDVGALVVIFDANHDDRYTYLATWQGEHQNESDMAFFATNPSENVVGPGIGRAEYGGFLMTLPPRRMAYVWSDPDYAFAESKPETLLMAALDYSTQKHVVYVAAKPPRSIFRTMANRLNRSIIYVPIGALSSEKLKKLRVVHILDSHSRRESAKDFIW